MIVPWVDLAKLVTDAGFSGTGAANALAIIRAESGRNTEAVNVNDEADGLDPSDPAFGSVDRGLWQINSFFHPNVTEAQAFDPVFATDWAFSASRGGTDFHPWSAYKNRAYERHLETAKVALDGWSRVKALQRKVSTLTVQRDAAAAKVEAARALVTQLLAVLG